MLCGGGNSRGALGVLCLTQGQWGCSKRHLRNRAGGPGISRGFSWSLRAPLAFVGTSWDSWGAPAVCGDVSVTMRTLLGDIWGARGVSWGLWGPLRAPWGFVGELRNLGGNSGLGGDISGIVGALPGIVRRLGDAGDAPEVCAASQPFAGFVRAPQRFGGHLKRLERRFRLWPGRRRDCGAPGVCGCPRGGRPRPAPPQGRPQREAGRARRPAGGARGPGAGGRAAWAAGGRRCSPAPAQAGRPAPPAAMARPRGLGRIPELPPAAFPGAAAEDEAFLPEPPALRAPRRPRSPPSSPVFFASPTLRRRVRLLRSVQDGGRQAWAG